jgi:hypothetical protein
MERAIRGFHQGQRSLTASTGRTHDRTRPIEVMLGVTSRNYRRIQRSPRYRAAAHMLA